MFQFVAGGARLRVTNECPSKPLQDKLKMKIFENITVRADLNMNKQGKACYAEKKQVQAQNLSEDRRRFRSEVNVEGRLDAEQRHKLPHAFQRSKSDTNVQAALLVSGAGVGFASQDGNV